MVHERDDEYESQEDGEYHFSDDQANYEMEPEVTKTATASPSKAALPGGVAGVAKFKRPIIGVLVFFFVIFLVYKIITPSTNAPVTDFSQNNNVAPTAKPITIHQPVEKTTVVTTTTTTAQPAAAQTVAAPTITAPPPVAAPTPTVAVEQPQPVVQTQPQPQQSVAQGMPSLYQEPAQPVAAQGNEMSSPQTVNAIDKLISLQDQNTKLANQLQAESAQKLAEYEAQNNEMQGKLQDMTMRVNALEATLNHLTKVIQESRNGGARADMNEGSPVIMAARPVSQARAAFSVQAIIPGRAWLKSDNGETITVAEGDILKNYGKIIKIDPYDGVVQIDTAGKLVTLSYGASTE